MVGPIVLTGRLVGALAWSDVRLLTDYRLDPSLFTLEVKLYGAVHYAVVSQRKRRHTQGFSFADKLVDFAQSIQEGVVRVDVEMDEIRFSHAYPL